MDFLTELFTDAHFWIGVAFVVFIGVLVAAGVPKMLLGMLDDRAGKVQSQLDEAQALRDEAVRLLAEVKTQKEQAERFAAEVMANAEAEAERLQIEAQAKLAETLERRSQMAERKIAQAEAQAEADVRAAAAELATRMAEQVLTARLAGATSDPLIDAGIRQLSGKLQ
jgi:F-type H+-transporting ATPase subunit b